MAELKEIVCLLTSLVADGILITTIAVQRLQRRREEDYQL